MQHVPFEQIVRRHGPTVLRVCRAVLGPHEAEDAWSETFLSALRAYPGLEPGANVQAWLVTIAKRKAIDQHRAAKRIPVPTDILPEAGELTAGDAAGSTTGSAAGSASDGRSTSADTGDEDGALAAALQLLPLRQREAIAYHYLAGLPYRDVAPILGSSEAAARRSAADGIRKLRQHLKQTGLETGLQRTSSKAADHDAQ